MRINAKFESVCGCGCDKKIVVGESVEWSKGKKAVKADCFRKKTGRAGSNPWVTKAMYGSTASAFGEHGVYFSEYELADEMEPEKCASCGELAHYKPSVGSWVCFNRHVRLGEGKYTSF